MLWGLNFSFPFWFSLNFLFGFLPDAKFLLTKSLRAVFIN